MKREAGFTLVELLVVMSLVALIGMSMYAMFGSAIDMMRRVSGSEVAEDVGIFFEKLDREISSQVIFRGIPFEGKEMSVSFPARIGWNSKSPANKGIGRISYFFDESNKAFARRQENLSQIYKKEEIEASSGLQGVESLKYQYFVYLKAKKTFEWVEAWNALENGGVIPSAVKVKFECVEGEERYVFERIFRIPIAESAR